MECEIIQQRKLTKHPFVLFHQTAECTSRRQPRSHHPGSPLSTKKLKKKKEKLNDEGSNVSQHELYSMCIHIRNGQLRHSSKQILRATSRDRGGIKHENKATTGKTTQLIYYRCESKMKQKGSSQKNKFYIAILQMITNIRKQLIRELFTGKFINVWTCIKITFAICVVFQRTGRGMLIALYFQQ